jgi:hypothetical protein
MQVHTKIELEPTINYVSASNDNFLDRLEIDDIGEYGFRNSKSVSLGSVNKEKVFSVNTTNYKTFKDALENNNNVVGVVETAKENELNAFNNANDYFVVSDTSSFSSQENLNYALLRAAVGSQIKKLSLSGAGLQRVKTASDSYKFGVERIKCGYIIDDVSLSKKSSIKNLRNYYSENIEHNNFYDSTWGFKNYNSLNFFNIGAKTNSNFRDDTTHKNCIIYPNLIHSNNTRQQYNFKDLKDFTVSFYINPKYKNNVGKHLNPGCILSIPGVLSVFLVKGSSLDENGLTDGFRLYIQFGDSTFSNLSNDDFVITNSEIQNNSLNYLSKDNVLKYNNWHLVALCYKKNFDNYDFTLCVDGKIIGEEYNQVANIDQSNIDNSYIEIGNKHIITKYRVSDFVNKCFSKSLVTQNDNKGPYVNKHIVLGSQIDSVLNDIHDSNNIYDLENSLNSDNSDYILDNTSKALSAELSDIRFYKQFLDVDKCLEISKKGISSISNEKLTYDLIFYVPFYYYSQDVKKKGLVNLSAPYKAFSPSILGEMGPPSVIGIAPPSLRGAYLDSSDNEISNNRIPELTEFGVKLENISYNYPINPVYYAFTGGTDVSVEHFCREFVSNTQPNIAIGNNIEKDSYGDCFLLTPDKILNNHRLNNVVKKGGTADDLLFDIFDSSVLNSDEISSLTNYDHQNNNIIYRNYMILPNDNGIQQQYYEKDNFNYESNNLYQIHFDRFDNLRLDTVNLDKTDKRFSISKTRSERRNVLTGISETVNRYYDINSKVGRLLALSSFNYDSISRFKESSDKLLNISLSNYHSDDNVLYILNDDVASVASISKYHQYHMNADTYGGDILTPNLNERRGFFGSFSNPAQRSFYSSYENAISESEVYNTKSVSSNESIVYRKLNNPLDSIGLSNYENISTFHCISTQVFNNSIKRETFEIKDVDLPLSSGIKLTFKDTRLGTLYRADSSTAHAEWGTCGGLLYDEGISMLHHPSVWSLGKSNISIKAKTKTSTNIFELNLPAQSGETNQTKNSSKIENIRLDESAFNSDEDFVYITDIDLHDENLNIVASVKLAQPFAKKDSDNVLFRIKMDY